jgi:hypothetical protein
MMTANCSIGVQVHEKKLGAGAYKILKIEQYCTLAEVSGKYDLKLI